MLDTITAILNEYLEKFDLTATLDTDFGYYRYDDLITYTVVVTERFDKLFQNFVETNFPLVNAPIFLWSLFHEIGHAETDDDLDDDLYDFCENAKIGINPDNDEEVMAYFNLPDEYAATEWAYYYFLNHKEEVTELWDRIRPEIEKLHLTITD